MVCRSMIMVKLNWLSNIYHKDRNFGRNVGSNKEL